MKMPSPGTLVIINPHAGVQPVNFIIARDLERRKTDLKCLRTMSIADTKQIIGQNLENYKVFVAAGGDGTVHSVAAEIVGSDKILGVLPMGSGNGFAKEFGFALNIRALLSNISKGETMCIDVIEINGHLCLNVAGIGLDSFVAHSFNELRLRGFLPYIWLTLKTFLRLKPFHVKISSAEGQVFAGELFVLTIANTRQFGNNAFIAPDAKPNDGKMDLVMIRPFPKILGPSFIVKLFTKKINKSRYVSTISTDSEIIIETDEARFHIDGEPLAIKEKIIVNVRKKVLKVLKTPNNKFLHHHKE